MAKRIWIVYWNYAEGFSIRYMQQINNFDRFFVVLLYIYTDINHQEWVRIKYQSIIQIRDVYPYMYKILDLCTQLYP